MADAVQAPECEFECPYGCDDDFDGMDGWAKHMRNEHGVDGPL